MNNLSLGKPRCCLESMAGGAEGISEAPASCEPTPTDPPWRRPLPRRVGACMKHLLLQSQLWPSLYVACTSTLWSASTFCRVSALELMFAVVLLTAHNDLRVSELFHLRCLGIIRLDLIEIKMSAGSEWRMVEMLNGNVFECCFSAV